MKEDIQKEAIDIAIGAFEKFSVEKDVAEHIKKTFDKKYGPTWHCIVGKNFGFLSALAVNSRGWRSRATAAREMYSSSSGGNPSSGDGLSATAAMTHGGAAMCRENEGRDEFENL
ncbi:hypothetical protein SASPL_147645 [Salvia splendens]|uniref:Dynein light chain n=1 Tax=Salvia splendens TaxID=180675 RepID=A0A8X8Z6W6_SALSN|nr:hypothetical protein SASPL_147645 [Salvia splendens]